MSNEFSKEEQKLLKELESLAYERKLEQKLDKLEENFIRWRNEEIDSYKMRDKILEFQSDSMG